jgi:hypothetical protein
MKLNYRAQQEGLLKDLSCSKAYDIPATKHEEFTHHRCGLINNEAFPEVQIKWIATQHSKVNWKMWYNF